jgi:hypothetical protein
MSIRSPTLKGTLPAPEPNCSPLGMVQVNVVSAPFWRTVNVKSAFGGVTMKQVRPVKVPATAITCCTFDSVAVSSETPTKLLFARFVTPPLNSRE